MIILLDIAIASTNQFTSVSVDTDQL